MVPCDNSLILDISLWERLRTDNQTISSIINILYWWHDCHFGFNLHTATAHSWMWSTYCLWGQLGESALQKRKADWGRTTMMVDHKSLSEGHEMSFKYCQGSYIDNSIVFHQLWGKQRHWCVDSTQLAGSVENLRHCLSNACSHALCVIVIYSNKLSKIYKKLCLLKTVSPYREPYRNPYNYAHSLNFVCLVVVRYWPIYSYPTWFRQWHYASKELGRAKHTAPMSWWCNYKKNGTAKHFV